MAAEFSECSTVCLMSGLLQQLLCPLCTAEDGWLAGKHQ